MPERTAEDLAMAIQPDRGARQSLSEQIVSALRTRILNGEFGTGEALPSSRRLGEALGVARSVVVRAYEQLYGEGYLEARPGAATAVASGIVAGILAGPGAAILTGTTSEGHLSALPASASPTGGPRGTARPIDLRPGYPFANAAVPVEWRRALTVAAREPLGSYQPPHLGDPRLREQIAIHAQRSRGIRCSPDDVIVTTGTSDSLLLIGLAMGAGRRIAMEDPGYQEAARVLQRTGAVIEPVRVTAEGLTSAQLRRLALRPDAVFVTPSHQFPLGGRMPAAERTALVSWAVEHGALIIEDDYDSEFRHTGPVLPATAALETSTGAVGTVAHIGSLNKSFSPSLRCGYLIVAARSPLGRAVAEVKADLGSSTSAAIQAATASFFASGAFRRYIARTRREYRHRRALLIEHFSKHGMADRLTGTDGGLHAVLRLPLGRMGTAVAAELGGRGVLVDAIAEYTRLCGPSAPPDDAIAIGYGAESTPRLLEGLDEVSRIIGR
jgi:GntR family transcriptional regulator/MocR family aminotransferase